MQELIVAAKDVVARLLAVYRPDYIQKCVEQDPESLLARVKHLESVIAKAEARGAAVGEPAGQPKRSEG